MTSAKDRCAFLSGWLSQSPKSARCANLSPVWFHFRKHRCDAMRKNHCQARSALPARITSHNTSKENDTHRKYHSWCSSSMRLLEAKLNTWRNDPNTRTLFLQSLVKNIWRAFNGFNKCTLNKIKYKFTDTKTNVYKVIIVAKTEYWQSKPLQTLSEQITKFSIRTTRHKISKIANTLQALLPLIVVGLLSKRMMPIWKNNI